MANLIKTILKYSSGLRLAMIQHLTILDQFLGTRPKDKTQPWVIAIDGLDMNAVQMMIANLYHFLTRDLGRTVRIVG